MMAELQPVKTRRVTLWAQPDALPAEAAQAFAREFEQGLLAIEALTGERVDAAHYGGSTVHVFVSSRVTISHVYGGYAHPRFDKAYLYLSPQRVKNRTAPYLHELTHIVLWHFGSHSLREASLPMSRDGWRAKVSAIIAACSGRPSARGCRCGGGRHPADRRLPETFSHSIGLIGADIDPFAEQSAPFAASVPTESRTFIAYGRRNGPPAGALVHRRMRRQRGLARSGTLSVARLTLPPAWRSRRPARSSSSSTSCTAAAGQRRTGAPARRPAPATGRAGLRRAAAASSSASPSRAARLERPPAERDAAVRGADRLDHVGGALDQRRAVADQLVAALRARVERRAGHRHHLAPRLRRQPRGDQRAGLGRRLDHHRARAPGRR